MNKRELRKHKILLCTKKQIDSLKNSARWMIIAEQIQIDDENILVINAYKNKSYTIGTPEYRTFMTKDDYITQDINEDRWKTGALWRILEFYWWGSEFGREAKVDKASINIINKYFNIEDSPLKTITYIQKEIMDKRLAEKHKKITDRIDQEMEGIGELPEDFDQWIDEIALYESRYIYYKYLPRKKYLDGYCTHCKTNVKVSDARHNKKGICPNCKSPITFKAEGKSGRVIDRSECALINKVRNKLVIRHFSIKKEYGYFGKETETYRWEPERDILHDGNVKIYEYGEFKQSGKCRWCDDMGKYDFRYEALYDKNLEILKDTEYKYSAIREFAAWEPGNKFDVLNYLKDYMRYPVIEYLVKMGLFRLVRDVVRSYCYTHSVNKEGKNVVEVLGVDKQDIPQLQRLNVSGMELEIIQKANEANKKLTDEQVKVILNSELYIDQVLEVSQYTTIHQILKYINKIYEIDKKNKEVESSKRLLLSDYTDYISNCEKLKYDLKDDFILFPKNLREAHDKTSDLVVEGQNKKYDEAIKKMYKEYCDKYEWEYEDYMIVVPKSAMRIVNEGKRLRHCVGSYLERVAKKETVILFLRKKDNPEKNFYTLEVRKGKIIQCRGYKNESYDKSKELTKVINKFKKDKLDNKSKKKKIA